MTSTWVEEQGLFGVRRWRNTRTGAIQYRSPFEPHPKYISAERNRQDQLARHQQEQTKQQEREPQSKE